MVNIPQRLCINGRKRDDEFEQNEVLYLRFKKTHFDSSSRFPILAVRFPDCSVNRSKYSEPEDVLLPNWLDYGIAQVMASDIPTSIPEDETVTFTVKHDPVGPGHDYFATQGFENYAHAEIRAYRDNIHLKSKEAVKSLVRKKFRTAVGEAMSIIRDTSV